MKRKMIELYQKNELEKLRRVLFFQIAMLAAVAAIALTACIVICTKVSAYNSKELLYWCVGISTAGSWIALSIRIFGIDGTRSAIKHTAAMLEGERETVTGTFALTGERVRVRNGVSMIRVLCDSSERVGTLQLYEKKRERFNAQNTERVQTVYGFVVAYEEDVSDD
jgi:hypothetical protein